MKFISYTHWDQLPTYSTTLFHQCEKDSLFFSRTWFENVTHSLEDNETLLLACVVADDKMMAILPLIKTSGKTWYALKHRYTTHFSLLLAKLDNDQQQQALTCLVQGLNQLPFAALILEPVADDDINLNKLKSVMEKNDFNCDYNFRFYNWVCRIHGQTYNDYIEARPAQLRNTIVRKKRKLEREHGYEIRLFTGGEVPKKMSDYYTAYSASWKANEQYVDFLNGVVTSFSKSSLSGTGWSRLAVLYVKEQPIAAQLWFVVHAKASIFRLSYDKDWKPYSPGSILTSFLMEYVIDTDKVEEIDFLTGNDRYKQDWMSERRERFAMSCIKTSKPTNRYHQFINKILKRLKIHSAQP